MNDHATPVASCPPALAFRRYWLGYVRFDGRSSRSEYWWPYLFTALISLALGLLSPVLPSLWALATLLPSLACLTRRLRDAGVGVGSVVALLCTYVGGWLAAIVGVCWTVGGMALAGGLTDWNAASMVAGGGFGVWILLAGLLAEFAAWVALVVLACRPSKPVEA